MLIRYPFTDLSGAKVRPALVVSPDNLLPRVDDVLCLFISSSIPSVLLPTDFVLESGHGSFAMTGLKRRSLLRMHKLALLHKTLVVRVLGQADPALMHEVNRRLRLALGPVETTPGAGNAPGSKLLPSEAPPSLLCLPPAAGLPAVTSDAAGASPSPGPNHIAKSYIDASSRLRRPSQPRRRRWRSPRPTARRGGAAGRWR